MISRYNLGKIGEYIAVFWLYLKGYKVLALRYKNTAGEIDIIAKKQKTLVFIEVKTRKKKAYLADAVTSYQKQRISHSAEYYLAKKAKYNKLQYRFDIIYFVPWFYLRHHKAVW